MEQHSDFFNENSNLRFSWNVFPQNKLDKERFIIPTGFHYTPLKQIDDLQILEYDPLLCGKCSSVLNPFCNVDLRSKSWECPFCLKKNLFPQAYAQFISETNLPSELMQEHHTVEYRLEKKQLASHPIIFFLIDTAIEEEELCFLKEKIQTVIDGLPDESRIGIITFGTLANLLEVGFTDFSRFYSFNGERNYNANDIQNVVGINSNNSKLYSKKFVLPKSECNFNISSFLDDLTIDLFPKGNYERKKNCGGLALNIAVTLLEIISNGDPCRIELFLGGAPNIGEGKIVSTLLKEPIRNFVDFQKKNENTKYFQTANKYYNDLSRRALKSGIIIDLLLSSFNQVGILEMKSCVEMTGGIIILSDSFSHSCFKESFVKLFEQDENGYLKMNYKGKIDVFITKPYQLSGGLGYLSSVELKNQNALDMVSKDVVIGEGNTRVWNLGGITSNSTYSFILDVLDSSSSNKKCIGQIVTNYIASDLSHRMRVTSFKRRVAGEFNSSLLEIAQSFDQEASTVLLAKLAVEKGYKQEQIETLRWLDKIIIRVVSKFSEYKKDDVNSFKPNSKFNQFPQYMYYLRRSPFISDFNSSLDESIFYKSSLMTETMLNCTIMIQPILYVYTPETPEPSPVHLDIDYMRDDNVLYLDAFFFICIWHGRNVCDWRDKGLHEDPEYENIKSMLESPQEIAQDTLSTRLPVSKYISCDSGNGQERYIKCTVNPSVSNSDSNSSIPEGFYTDDVSLKKFIDHLKKKVVSSQQI